MNSAYSLIIQWSEEERLFVVSLPEFTDVMQSCTHGHTYEEAAKHGQELLETLIEIYQEDGKPLPEPQTLGKPLPATMIYKEDRDRKRRKLLDHLIEMTEEAGLYKE